MASRSQFSDEDVKQIGLRIRSARVLSGMNQEEFANTHGIPHMSLKAWEMGKALPRQIGLEKLLNALFSIGIQVDCGWLISGSGAGPTYVFGTRRELSEGNTSHSDDHVAIFKKEQLARGLNPLVVEINDSLMSPSYKPGDIVGGVFISHEEVKARCKGSIEKGSIYLVHIDEAMFAPRQVFFANEQIFISSLRTVDLSLYSNQFFAKICWHYFPDSQT